MSTFISLFQIGWHYMSGYLKGLDLIRGLTFWKKYSLTYCKTYLFKTKDLLERHIQKNIELHSLYSRRYLGPHRTRPDIFEIHRTLQRPKTSTWSTEISKPQKISDHLGPNGPRTKRRVDHAPARGYNHYHQCVIRRVLSEALKFL